MISLIPFKIRFYLPFLAFIFLCFLTIFIHPLIWIITLTTTVPADAIYRRLVRWTFNFVIHFGEFNRIIYIKRLLKDLDSTQNRNEIIVCNHISLIDVLLIIGTFPDTFTFVKESIYKSKIVHHIVSKTGFISVNINDPQEASESFLKAKEILKNGGRLVVFPEGTRSPTNKLLPFQKGAFRLSVECNVPVRCISFKSNQPFLVSLKNFLQISSPTHFEMEELETFYPPTYCEATLNQDCRKFSKQIHQFFNSTLQERGFTLG